MVGKATLLALASLLLDIGNAYATGFDGTFEFRWLETPSGRHRDMQLLSPVSFTDKSGKVWKVPTGAKVDGASIPAILWSFAGSPFVGNYRRASVIHDYFCEAGGATTEAIDDMFLEGMLADGVPQPEALSKYGAVYLYQATSLGTCGKLQKPRDKLTEFKAEGAIKLTPEAELQLGQLQDKFTQYEGEKGLQMETIGKTSDLVAKSSNVQSPQTLQALIAYRVEPTQDTYQAIQVAVEKEKPTEDEYKQLMYIAAITPPPALPK